MQEMDKAMSVSAVSGTKGNAPSHTRRQHTSDDALAHSICDKLTTDNMYSSLCILFILKLILKSAGCLQVATVQNILFC